MILLSMWNTVNIKIEEINLLLRIIYNITNKHFISYWQEYLIMSKKAEHKIIGHINIDWTSFKEPIRTINIPLN